jgi:hypothetical protein
MDIYGSTETLDCVAYVDYLKLKIEGDKLKEQLESERGTHRLNTSMLKDQIEGLIIDNQLLGERVLAYQRLKQINDISRPSNEA